MDRATLAELMLRRVVGASRAAELVGDQLEARPAESDLRFWLSIAWLLAVFSWRTVVGILTASIAGLFLSWVPFAFAVTRGSLAGKAPSPLPDPSYYFAISQLLWTAAIFSLARFGFRSHLARIGLVGAVLGTIALCTFWLTFGPIAALGSGTLFLLLCLRRSKDRRAVMVLFSGLASGGIMMRVLLSFRPPSYDLKWVLIMVLSQLLLVASAECIVALLLHERLLGSAEIQSQRV